MEWTVGVISAGTDFGLMPVAGWIKGHFGLDFRIWEDQLTDDIRKGWCVTHLPTGRVTMGVFAPLARAQELVDEFAALADWSFADADLAKNMAPIAKGFRNTHGDIIAYRSPSYGPLWPVEAA